MLYNLDHRVPVYHMNTLLLRQYRVMDLHNPDYIHFYRNFPPEDYVKVLANCACVVGNSSSGIREGAFLGVPTVNIGNRQARRERGANVVDVPYDWKAIKAEVDRLIGKSCPPVELYGDGRSGERIARVLANREEVVAA
jgi:UDP-N-acetylglucosamine 2-epimerase